MGSGKRPVIITVEVEKHLVSAWALEREPRRMGARALVVRLRSGYSGPQEQTFTSSITGPKAPETVLSNVSVAVKPRDRNVTCRVS